MNAQAEKDNSINDHESPSAVESEYVAPSLTTIYARGDDIKLNVSFNHPQFSSEHVRNFIMDAPYASLWTIEFKEKFTLATLLCLHENMYRQAFEYCFTIALHCTSSYMSKINKLTNVILIYYK